MKFSLPSPCRQQQLVKWNDSFRKRAHVYDLAPGVGGYMPSTSAHLVEEVLDPSITMSFTYYTDSTRRREMLYRGNARLRRWGFNPHPIGKSSGRDSLKHAVLNSYFKPVSAIRRMVGRGVRDTTVKYAPV